MKRVKELKLHIKLIEKDKRDLIDSHNILKSELRQLKLKYKE